MDEFSKDSTSPISTTPIMQTITPSIIDDDNKELIEVVTIQSATGRRAPSSNSSKRKKTKPKNKTKTKTKSKIAPTVKPTTSSSSSSNKVSFFLILQFFFFLQKIIFFFFERKFIFSKNSFRTNRKKVNQEQKQHFMD